MRDGGLSRKKGNIILKHPGKSGKIAIIFNARLILLWQNNPKEKWFLEKSNNLSVLFYKE